MSQITKFSIDSLVRQSYFWETNSCYYKWRKSRHICIWRGSVSLDIPKMMNIATTQILPSRPHFPINGEGCLWEMANSRVEARERKMNLKYAVVSESNKVFKYKWIGTSLAVQWLRLCASNAGGLGLIPSQRIRSCVPQLKILHATMKMLYSHMKVGKHF